MLASHRRSDATDSALGMLLAFIAGAINAGGFFAIGTYTSHMTGIMSSIADQLALGVVGIIGIAMVVFFTAGAACSAMVINWGRRNAPTLQYVFPLGLEALLLLCFGGTDRLGPAMTAVLVAPLLSFIMGLQNATITKISGARVRTTHVTGMITDIGIELGKLGYRNGTPARPASRPVTANRPKLVLLLQMVGMFLAGGLAGAFGYGFFGSGFSLPLAVALILPLMPVTVRKRRRE